LLYEYNKPLYNENQIETYVKKAFHYIEEQKVGQFKDYNDLKQKLKKDYKHNHEKLIEQIVDVIEQAHATNQFDDIDKPEVQTLLRDRLDGKRKSQRQNQSESMKHLLCVLPGRDGRVQLFLDPDPVD
jgi:hypothetical protein